jgi:hypothetical protein
MITRPYARAPHLADTARNVNDAAVPRLSQPLQPGDYHAFGSQYPWLGDMPTVAVKIGDSRRIPEFRLRA